MKTYLRIKSPRFEGITGSKKAEALDRCDTILQRSTQARSRFDRRAMSGYFVVLACALATTDAGGFAVAHIRLCADEDVADAQLGDSDQGGHVRVADHHRIAEQPMTGSRHRDRP